MKITTENINRFKVIENNRSDERVMVAELAGKYEGTLIFDNAGASLTMSDFDTVVEACRNNSEVEGLVSTTVSGIVFRNDYSAGWVCENIEK